MNVCSNVIFISHYREPTQYLEAMVNLAKLLVRPQWEPQEILDQQAHLSLTIAKDTKKISFGHIPKDFFKGS